MGGLAHYIEEEGIATTQISLIREHSETIKPPRVLWVPFDLGRPFGSPNEPDFQRDVLRHVMSLLEYQKGPVLEDYPHDAEQSGDQVLEVACPVNFSTGHEPATSLEKLFQALQEELLGMQTWHDAYAKTNRTTTGISGMTLEEITVLFQDFIGGRVLPDENQTKLSDLLRMATEDIKAFYFEAISAQPGQSTNVSILADWFWGKTCAAKIINEVRSTCMTYEAKDMLLAGKLLLIPRNQMFRFNG